MTRILIAIAFTATGLSLWTVSAKAADWQTPGFFGHTAQLDPHLSANFIPALYWPKVGHEPAITKTLNAVPNITVPQAPAPAYSYDWQDQPVPPAPMLSSPQFSHPQQGFYPREEISPQIAPGYEYDFGGSESPSPIYPIEGAKWKSPRTYHRATSFAGAIEASNASSEYAHCPL